jgi:hypothetical protein
MTMLVTSVASVLKMTAMYSSETFASTYNKTSLTVLVNCAASVLKMTAIYSSETFESTYNKPHCFTTQETNVNTFVAAKTWFPISSRDVLTKHSDTVKQYRKKCKVEEDEKKRAMKKTQNNKVMADFGI